MSETSPSKLMSDVDAIMAEHLRKVKAGEMGEDGEPLKPPLSAAMVTALTNRYGKPEEAGRDHDREDEDDSLTMNEGVDTENGHLGLAS